MSYDVHVYCKKESLPTCAAWVAALVQAEFPIELVDDISLASAEGWHPVRYNEFESGFELSSAAIGAEQRTELGIAPEYDFAITISAPHDAAAIAAGIGAAAALANASGGVLVDADSGEKYDGEEGKLETQQVD